MIKLLAYGGQWEGIVDVCHARLQIVYKRKLISLFKMTLAILYNFLHTKMPNWIHVQCFIVYTVLSVSFLSITAYVRTVKSL
jgi:hypothetical protein